MAFSGVRSSWLMRERNSLFARFARSDSSFACSSASRDSLLLGDVDRDAGNAIDPPVAVLYREGAVEDPAHRSIRPHDAVLLLIVAADLLGHRGVRDALLVLRVDRLQPRAGRSVQDLAGLPQTLS